MEVAVNANGSEVIQTTPTNEEEFRLISEDEAAKKSIRTRLEPHVFSRYAHHIQQIREGGWCAVRTLNYKSTRKTLLVVAGKMDVPLVVEKTLDGLQFRAASPQEVLARKKKPASEKTRKR